MRWVDRQSGPVLSWAPQGMVRRSSGTTFGLTGEIRDLWCFKSVRPINAPSLVLPAPTQIRYQIRQGRRTANVARENDKRQTWIGRFRAELESGDSGSDLPENPGSFRFQPFRQNIV